MPTERIGRAVINPDARKQRPSVGTGKKRKNSNLLDSGGFTLEKKQGTPTFGTVRRLGKKQSHKEGRLPPKKICTKTGTP